MEFDISAITPDYALSILKTLANEDKRIAQRIKEIMVQLTGFISSENICQQILLTLSQIDVEELWDRSGPKRDGYIEPCEMACEMVEEAMEPFIDQLEEYRSLGMIEEAKFYCMGVLHGLYLFDKESKSPFRDWADDIACEVFSCILEKWQKSPQNKNSSRDMKEFIEKNCPQWSSS